MILLIDNYDSFVYNLSRAVRELNFVTLVKRNNAITLQEISRLQPSHIIISPGPCTPNEAGISLDVIAHFAGSIPILGVCLGHQAIGQVYGCKITRAKHPMHGKASPIIHEEHRLFKGLGNPFTAARYHSLIVSEACFSDKLIVIARSQEGEIMALAHRALPIYGVQFHPESILTHRGHDIIKNFIYSA